MKYQWILFDADETLFHFDNFAGLKNMFARYDVNFEQADFDEYQNVNKPLWVQYQNGEITAEELQTTRFESWSKTLNIPAKVLNEEFLDSMAEICEPLAGALELISFLKEHNIQMGIITNGFAQLQNVRLERTGFKPYFPLVVVSELVGVAKPSPLIFQYALDQMIMRSTHAFNKNQVLMVGDTLESDILGGKNFGFDTCWLNHHDKKSTKEIQPTHQVKNLNELLEYLKA